jgi:hypothetical protein
MKDEAKFYTHIFGGKLESKTPFVHVGIDGMIILKFILKQKVIRLSSNP